MIITKNWQQIESTSTLDIPFYQGVLVCASDTEPTGDDGVYYAGVNRGFFTEKKLWVKIPSTGEYDTVKVSIGNFM
ncbi:MAG: hypothetical protein ACRCX2_29795 [Paraclostridium sp.]